MNLCSNFFGSRYKILIDNEISWIGLAIQTSALLTPTVCQQPMQKVIFVPKFATRVTIFQKTPVSFIGYIPHFEAFIVPVNLHLMPCVWGKLRAPGAHSTKNGILTPLFNK